MIHRNYGPGIAPAVTWAGDHWLVVIGARVLTIAPDGTTLDDTNWSDAWGFPALAWPWAFYKGTEAVGWRAILRHIPSGARYSFGTADGNFPVALGSGYAVWQSDGNAFRVYRVPLFDISNPMMSPQALGLGAPDGIAWVDTNGLPVFRKDAHASIPGMTQPQHAGGCTVGENSTGGFKVLLGGKSGVLLPGADTKTPAVAESPNGQYAAVGWGEQGVHFVIFTADDLPAAPPHPADPIGVSMRVRAMPRKMWFAPFFSHSEKYGFTDDHIGNAILCVEREDDPSVLPRELAEVAKLGLPLIVDGTRPQDSRFDDLTVARWASGASINELGASAVAADLNPVTKPTIAYLDSRHWPEARPDWLNDRMWPAVQVYRNAGESLDAFIGAMTDVCVRVERYGRPMVLVPAFFTRNGAVSVDEIAECMPVYEELARELPVIGILPFADRRPTGMLEHAQLRAWAAAFYDAIPLRPNRYDGWTPRGLTPRDVLGNKLRQDVDMRWLSTDECALLLKLLEGEPPPAPQPPTPGNPYAYPPELEDQLPLVKRIRRDLFPDKFQPGHPDANDDGFLPLHDARRAMLFSRAIALALKSYGVGIVRAKQGSSNNVDGYTTDAVALKNGVHWDTQVDGHDGAAFPNWSRNTDPNNYPPIADRWEAV